MHSKPWDHETPVPFHDHCTALEPWHDPNAVPRCSPVLKALQKLTQTVGELFKCQTGHSSDGSRWSLGAMSWVTGCHRSWILRGSARGQRTLSKWGFWRGSRVHSTFGQLGHQISHTQIPLFHPNQWIIINLKNRCSVQILDLLFLSPEARFQMSWQLANDSSTGPTPDVLDMVCMLHACYRSFCTMLQWYINELIDSKVSLHLPCSCASCQGTNRGNQFPRGLGI